MLFRSEPRSQSADWSPSRAVSFVSDPATLGVRDGSADVLAVSVPADRMDRLRRSGSDGFVVPVDIARTASPLDDASISKFVTMRDAYEEAKVVRRSMALMKEDCAVPGEMSPVARLLWRHVPEAAARAGVAVPEGEGGPVLSHLERDIERSRPVAAHLSCREDAAFLAGLCDGTTPAIGIMRGMSRASRSGWDVASSSMEV